MAAAASPDRILKELAELWVSLAREKNGENGGVLRACSMTLAVLTDGSEDAAALGETIAALMPEHPARTVVVRLRAGGPVEARVFAQCWMPFGQRRQICCEQVEVSAGDADLEDVAALLLPLAVPDLPVVLWVRTGRAQDLPGFAAISALAGKVIVDSSRHPDAQAALRRLAGVMDRGMLIGDLAWTRLTRLRETLARVFDNRELLGKLGEVSRIEVRYGGATPAVEAFYIGAWLSDSVRSAGAQAALEFVHDPAAAEGELCGIALSGGVEARVSAAGEVLSTAVNGVLQCTHMTRAGEYALLREELGIVRDDPIFRRTLSTAARLAVSSEGK